MVKDVNVEFRYQRVLLGGSFLDGKKRPRKIFTSISSEGDDHSAKSATCNTTLHLLAQKTQVTSMFGDDHPRFPNIKVPPLFGESDIETIELTNWINEDTLNDNLGHDTFVSGVIIAGRDSECLDVVSYGRDIMGSKISTGYKSLSETSVASPVVACIVCLLVRVIPEARRKDLLNPASMKQVLVEGAAKLSGPNMYEKGAGRVDLLQSYAPLYADAMPVIFNTTILNGMGVIGYIESPPTWHPANEEGNLLSIHFIQMSYGLGLVSYLALHMQIKEECAQFAGRGLNNTVENTRSARGDQPGKKVRLVLPGASIWEAFSIGTRSSSATTHMENHAKGT
ncbi:hypothetical protein Bca101_011490 [Brassica carinata]